jgi:hypothetical protein
LRNAGQWVIGAVLGLYFTPQVGALVLGLWWAIVLAVLWALALGALLGAWLQHRHATDLGLEPVNIREFDRLGQGDIASDLLHPTEAAMVFGGRSAVGVSSRKIQRNLAEPRHDLGRQQTFDFGQLCVQQPDGLLDQGGVLGDQTLIDPQGPAALQFHQLAAPVDWIYRPIRQQRLTIGGPCQHGRQGGATGWGGGQSGVGHGQQGS